MSNDNEFGRINPVALITGAASGIGAACARRLSEKADGGLILVDVDEDGLTATADGLTTTPERVSTMAFDVADPERWKQASDFIRGQYGRLDWAIVNAGVSHPTASLDDWRRIASTNLDGAFLTLRSVMPLMRANAQGGAIVVTGSAAGGKADAGAASQGAAKAGLLQMMRVAAKEGAADRIRINAVAPAGSEAKMWRNVPLFQDLVRETGNERAAFDRIAQLSTPLARYAAAADIARLIDLLLTAPSPITGATLVVEGGYTL